MAEETRSPRVLLHAFSTFKLGGPQSRFVQLANTFGARYHHVVAAMDNCFDAGDRLASHVQWEPLPLPNRRGGALANRSAFRSVLTARRPDMVLSYNWGAVEWCAANWPRLVPQVHVEDGFGPEEVQRQLPRRVWTRKVLLGLTRMPVVVASRQLEAIAVRIWKLPARNVCFIANGVSVDGSDIRQLPGGDPAPVLTIGTVAGLRPEKNIGRLIKAFALLRARENARLVIVGGGAELVSLQQLAADLKVSSDVEFTGYLENPSKRMVTFDLFALSSDTEQLPMAMLEAMACGLPIVTTRVGDVENILPSIAHAAISDVNDDAFASTLLHVVGKRDQWPDWIDAGKMKVQREYSLKVMHDRWQALFDGRIDSVFLRA